MSFSNLTGNPMARSGASPALVRVEGGTFEMGNHRDDGCPGEGETPVHTVRLDPFLTAPEAVTNRQVGEFAAARELDRQHRLPSGEVALVV